MTSERDLYRAFAARGLDLHKEVDVVAEICHEANRVYQARMGMELVSPAWHAAPVLMRESGRAGVLKIWTGEVKTPEDTHESWRNQKLAEGWVYGEVKDTAKKTHPCLRPFGELPSWQRRKDALFLAIAQALMP